MGEMKVPDTHRSRSLYGLALHLIEERDSARLEAKAATEVAVKYRDLWSQRIHPMDNYSASEPIVSAEKQRLIDEWTNERH
jgi:hypothetical protein